MSLDPISVAVLCGGKGTRLRELIGEHQKCAVEIGGRPWIHRVLDPLRSCGFHSIELLAGYQAREIRAAASWWISDLTPIAVHESLPIGVEAAIQAFFRRRSGGLIVMNGDTLVEGFDFREFHGLCQRVGRSVTVRGPSVLEPACNDSGIYYRLPGTRPLEILTEHPYLDIGTPEGLAFAREKFK